MNSMSNQELAETIAITHKLIQSTSKAADIYDDLIKHLKDLLSAQAERAKEKSNRYY